jgi:protein phosphatase 1L
MLVHFKSFKGMRPANEDRHTVILRQQLNKPIDIFGVYDGHGGSHVSTILSQIMPTLFANEQVIYPLTKTCANKICAVVQKYLATKCSNKSSECGSTCLMVFHTNNQLSVLNVGDSRAVMGSIAHTNAKQLTEDHKPANPREKQRITQQGGVVYFDGLDWRVENLSLSRAFGDTTSKYTSPVPDIYNYKLSPSDKFVILACDGLWDVMDTQTAVNFVFHFCFDKDHKRINDKLNIAEKLAEYALSLGSSDNVSVIVAFFNHP